MTLNKVKYKGVEKSLPNIHCDEVDMIYITRTNGTAFQEPSPLYLFTYNDDMYIGVCHLFKLKICSRILMSCIMISVNYIQVKKNLKY